MMPQGDPNAIGGGMPPAGGGQMPPQQGGQPGGDPLQMAAEYFQQVVQSLIASGLSEEQAFSQALQMVAQKFGPDVAQQLQMAAQGATQGGPAAPGPGNYGPAAPGTPTAMPPGGGPQMMG